MEKHLNEFKWIENRDKNKGSLDEMNAKGIEQNRNGLTGLPSLPSIGRVKKG